MRYLHCVRVINNVLLPPPESAVAQCYALETGVPLAKWLTNQSLAQGRKIEIFAHSLGNMVVNGALSRPEFRANSVTSYVVNEAAVPAEAFYQSYPSDPFFDQHGLDYGWSDAPPVLSYKCGYSFVLGNESVRQ